MTETPHQRMLALRWEVALLTILPKCRSLEVIWCARQRTQGTTLMTDPYRATLLETIRCRNK